MEYTIDKINEILCTNLSKYEVPNTQDIHYGYYMGNELNNLSLETPEFRYVESDFYQIKKVVLEFFRHFDEDLYNDLISALHGTVIHLDNNHNPRVSTKNNKIHVYLDVNHNNILDYTSMAHEFFHTIEHYFALKDNKKKENFRYVEIGSLFIEKLFCKFLVDIGLFEKEEVEKNFIYHFIHTRDVANRCVQEVKFFQLYDKYGEVNDSLLDEYAAFLKVSRDKSLDIIIDLIKLNNKCSILYELRYFYGDIVSLNLYLKYMYEDKNNNFFGNINSRFKIFENNKEKFSIEESMKILGVNSEYEIFDNYVNYFKKTKQKNM